MSPSDSGTVPHLRKGQQLGPFLIEKMLGQGGMGAVYKARDPRLNRHVALKVCTIPDNPAAVERFRREAQAAASLRHTNLCPVHEFDVRDGIAYIAMSFIEGPNLGQWVRDHPLDQRRAARLVAQLARAMQEVHRAGIIHRDLKPGNVAIDKNGRPVILDFGLARQLDDPRSRLTQVGGAMGTPAYMAPEQVENATAAGQAADVYSLGVMLYELLTGRLPFEGPPQLQLFHAVYTAPQPPSTYCDGLEPGLEAVCLQALAKKPEERFGSMRDFAVALERAAGSAAAPKANPATAPRRVAQPLTPTNPEVARQPTLPLPPPLSQTLPTSAPTPPSKRRQRSSPAKWLVLAVLVAILAGLGIWVWGAVHGPARDSGTDDHATSADQDKRRGTEKKPDPITEIRQLAPQPGENSLGMKFVKLPKGTFYMGWDGGNAGHEDRDQGRFRDRDPHGHAGPVAGVHGQQPQLVLARRRRQGQGEGHQGRGPEAISGGERRVG